MQEFSLNRIIPRGVVDLCVLYRNNSLPGQIRTKTKQNKNILQVQSIQTLESITETVYFSLAQIVFYSINF